MSRNVGAPFKNMHVRGDNAGLMGIESDAFVRCWARGQKATSPTARLQNKADGGVDANAAMFVKALEEDIDLGGASSVTSTNNLLPANSLILEIVTTPLVDFSTPTTYDVGDTTTNTRFATALANDNVSEGPAYASAHWDGTVAIRQVAAAKVKITPNAAGTGRVRVAVFYMQFVGGLA
jgi:hypothetical protein